jgi:GTPase involved in cell partitioning and DNA repair
VERTRLLVHLIDTSDTADMDPVKAYEIIEGELSAFSDSLTGKPRIVVASKLDATTDHAKLDELRSFCEKRGLEFHSISAATGDGVKELVRGMADALDKIPKEELEEAGENEEDLVEEDLEHLEAEAQAEVSDSENEEGQDEEDQDEPPASHVS